MYERKQTRPLSNRAFARRIAVHLLIAFIFLVVSLIIGMIGYSVLEHLSLVDGFINSAMLLGGMGPVNMPQTEAGKVFAGLYALYSGLGFLVVVALMLSPIIHRVLHTFHWEEES